MSFNIHFQVHFLSSVSRHCQFRTQHSYFCVTESEKKFLAPIRKNNVIRLFYDTLETHRHFPAIFQPCTPSKYVEYD